MTLVAPTWDRDFADSHLHGEMAQMVLMKSAMAYCKQFRRAVDVGAHIGIWTKFLVGKFARVDAFEPVSENMDCLRQNAESLSNVVLHEQALGADRGAVSLARHGSNSGCWRVHPGTGAKICRLDAFRYEDVDFLKIDVEGYEGYVLRGAEATLDASKPVVVIEENGLGKQFYGADWADPTVTLRKHGYRLRTRFNKDSIWSP